LDEFLGQGCQFPTKRENEGEGFDEVEERVQERLDQVGRSSGEEKRSCRALVCQTQIYSRIRARVLTRKRYTKQSLAHSSPPRSPRTTSTPRS
jgi:hypothetical protein